MSEPHHQRAPLDQAAAIRMILEGTATHTGEAFFRALVENVAKALDVMGAWVTEYEREDRMLRALAFIMNGEWIDEYEYEIAGTPCEVVIDNLELVRIEENIIALYPEDDDLEQFNAVSFMGFPLIDTDGTILGHLSVLDDKPMFEDPQAVALFKIFAGRATAELQRLRAEQNIREREEQLGRLVDNAMDAIVELDDVLHVSLANQSAEQLFGYASNEMAGTPVQTYFSEESAETLRGLAVSLEVDRGSEAPGTWIPEGLTVLRADGTAVPSEATLSCSKKDGAVFYTVILRSVRDRLEAEQRINTLTAHTEYLREQLDAMALAEGIIGESDALRAVLQDVEQVAKTDATVLILGETGTGKEKFAHAVHEASARAEKPLVKVNCAAIPAALMESEFFGHERGAFTGATESRVGRFALAEGGTIFLDEIGELSPDLQAKLLRVLQEGEFEAVGSSETQRVDVRVVAATNRDLEARVRDGSFREDLYYRLNVFPMRLPPLRERSDDVLRLAEVFADRYARRFGKKVHPISEAGRNRLKAYGWPGNIRELENVVERAVITSTDGHLNLDRALADTDSGTVETVSTPTDDEHRIRTVDELQQLERDNIRRALTAADWKVSGTGGAAELLGMKPSTLSSRIKALNITR